MNPGETEESSDDRPGAQSVQSVQTAVSAIHAAVTEFAQIAGRQPDGVTGVRPTGSGWSVLINVVELERIPASTSVLATYRVDVDRDGVLQSYERLRRYTRGATDL